MADQRHIDLLLKQGVTQWNIWRKQYPEIQPDLNGANLRSIDLRSIDLNNADLSIASRNTAKLSGARYGAANLSGANLSDTNLRSANLTLADLSGTNLSGADLSSATLNDADLSYANLSYATLIGVTLIGANLSGAKLIGADLIEANLTKTKLSGADLSDAQVSQTIFARVDLREAKGLVQVGHQGLSIIQLHTIQLPQNGSAQNFLRGCGVPDEWIDFWRATTMHPIQYHSCFISYTHQDEDLARRLHSDLQDHGVRCWFAPHDMKIGDKIRPRIDEAIHLQDKLLLILSEHSVASDWVEHEVETALARERREKRTILFPIRLDNAILEREHTGWPALVQHERHIGDFTGWKDHDQYQTAFDRLLHNLKKADE